MTRTMRRLLAATVLAGLFAGGQAYAQENLPRVPVPIVQGDAGGDPSPPPPPPPPQEGPLLYKGSVLRSPELPFFKPDPLLERPEDPPSGFFWAVEAGILGPHIKNRLTNTVVVNANLTDTVHLPSAELGGVVAPRFELGYRLPEGFGEFLLAYRFLTADGTEHFLDDQGISRLKSRLSLNVVDFDYASREFSLDPNWDMKWRIGARLAGAFFDSRFELLIPANNDGGGLASQHVSNNYWGAGPHVGLDLARRLQVPGLEIFTRIEAATLLGSISQNFDEFLTFNAVTLGGATHLTRTQAAPMGAIQLGLKWTPPGWNFSSFAIGYQYEDWWSVGKVDASTAEITDQGVFFRAELRY